MVFPDRSSSVIIKLSANAQIDNLRRRSLREREHVARLIRHVAGCSCAAAINRPEDQSSPLGAGWQNASHSEQNARAPHCVRKLFSDATQPRERRKTDYRSLHTRRSREMV